MPAKVEFTVYRIPKDPSGLPAHDPRRLAPPDQADIITELSKNARLHYRVRATRTRKWRRRAWQAWNTAGALVCPPPVKVTFTVCRPRRVDTLNALTCMHPLMDALTGDGNQTCPMPGMLPNDSDTYVAACHLIQEIDKQYRDREQVTITVESTGQLLMGEP